MSGIGAAGVGRTQAADTGQPHKTGSARKVQGSGPDEVSLSLLAEQLRALKPDSARQEKRLEELAAAFEAGSYQPDTEVVADALVDEAISEAQHPDPFA